MVCTATCNLIRSQSVLYSVLQLALNFCSKMCGLSYLFFNLNTYLKEQACKSQSQNMTIDNLTPKFIQHK